MELLRHHQYFRLQAYLGRVRTMASPAVLLWQLPVPQVAVLRSTHAFFSHQHIYVYTLCVLLNNIDDVQYRCCRRLVARNACHGVMHLYVSYGRCLDVKRNCLGKICFKEPEACTITKCVHSLDEGGDCVFY